MDLLTYKVSNLHFSKQYVGLTHSHLPQHFLVENLLTNKAERIET
jgi:hypothetical protein